MFEVGAITLDELRVSGVSERAIHAIDCLSKRSGEAYEDFIARIRPDELARKVKIEDIKDNLNLTLLTILGPKDLERIAKYHKALQYLSADT